MPETQAVCPECGGEHTYELGGLTVCSMCAHEWSPADGDTVVVVKGSAIKSSVVKKA